MGQLVKVAALEVDGVDFDCHQEILLSSDKVYFNPSGTRTSSEDVDLVLKELLTYEYAESDSQSDTTSSTFQTKVSISQTLALGKYRVGYCFDARCSGLLPSSETRVVFDGTVKYLKDDIQNAPYQNIAGFFEVEVTSAGSKTITIQHRATSGTSNIKNAKLELSVK